MKGIEEQRIVDKNTGLTLVVVKQYDDCDKVYDMDLPNGQEMMEMMDQLNADRDGISLEEYLKNKKYKEIEEEKRIKENIRIRKEKEAIRKTIFIKYKKVFEEQYKHVPVIKNRGGLSWLVKTINDEELNKYYKKSEMCKYNKKYSINDFIKYRANNCADAEERAKFRKGSNDLDWSVMPRCIKSNKQFFRRMNEIFRNKDNKYFLDMYEMKWEI